LIQLYASGNVVSVCLTPSVGFSCIRREAPAEAATQKRILSVIDESDYTLNSEQAMLNVAILVRRENEYENAQLIARRTENLVRLKDN
jgi:hypothetical protein